MWFKCLMSYGGSLISLLLFPFCHLHPTLSLTIMQEDIKEILLLSYNPPLHLSADVSMHIHNQIAVTAGSAKQPRCSLCKSETPFPDHTLSQSSWLCPTVLYKCLKYSMWASRWRYLTPKLPQSDPLITNE